jgi:hypothetical protein
MPRVQNAQSLFRRFMFDVWRTIAVGARASTKRRARRYRATRRAARQSARNCVGTPKEQPACYLWRHIRRDIFRLCPTACWLLHADRFASKSHRDPQFFRANRYQIGIRPNSKRHELRASAGHYRPSWRRTFQQPNGRRARCDGADRNRNVFVAKWRRIQYERDVPERPIDEQSPTGFAIISLN